MSETPYSPVRRVVTGHDAQNRSLIASDGPPTRVFDDLGKEGLVFYEIWNTPIVPVDIDRDDEEPGEDRLMLAPPAGGTRIRILDVPPDRQDDDLEDVFDAIGGSDAHIPGSERHASFHRTETIDYGIVLHGELSLLLDEGETTVGPGDVVIQRGTNHGWANRTSEACRILFVLVDGAFVDGLGRGG